MSSRPSTERMESKRCPSCGSKVPAAAPVCEMCGHEFGTTQAMPPVKLPEQPPKGSAPKTPRGARDPREQAQDKPPTTARPKTQFRPSTQSAPKPVADGATGGGVLSRLPWGVIGVAAVILVVVIGAMALLNRGNGASPTSNTPPTIEVQFNDPNAQPAAAVLTPTVDLASATAASGPSETPTLSPATNTPVPAPTDIPPIEYTVKAGDTCGVIAQRNGISLDAFTAFNNLDSVNCLIRVGDVLKIPAPTPTAGPSPTLPPGVTPSATLPPEPTATLPPEITYVVAGGDTCGKIAEKFNVTVDLIISQNNLDANCLIGLNQVLTLTFATATPAATATPFVLQTPTPRTGYAAPITLAPDDGASISETQEVVTLQWLTVGLLKPNEWYVIQVQPSKAITVPIFETKATSLKLTQEILGASTEDEITWWVQVKQLLATDPNTGARIYNDASQPSTPRRFMWRKPLATPTATPAP